MTVELRASLDDVFPQSGRILVNGHPMDTEDGQSLDRDQWYDDVEVTLVPTDVSGTFDVTAATGAVFRFHLLHRGASLLEHGEVIKLGERAWARQIDSVECTCDRPHDQHEVMMEEGIYTVPSSWVQEDVVQMWVPDVRMPDSSDRKLYNVINGENVLLP